MMRRGPCAAALSSARSWAWNRSSIARLTLMPLSPSGARAPSTAGRFSRTSVSLTSKVLIVTRPGAALSISRR
jgi:hypothetical protein